VWPLSPKIKLAIFEYVPSAPDSTTQYLPAGSRPKTQCTLCPVIVDAGRPVRPRSCTPNLSQRLPPVVKNIVQTDAGMPFNSAVFISTYVFVLVHALGPRPAIVVELPPHETPGGGGGGTARRRIRRRVPIPQATQLLDGLGIIPTPIDGSNRAL